MSLAIKLVGLVAGIPTPHDGRFLQEYDPSICWEEDGRLCVHLLSCETPLLAKRYEDMASLHADYTKAIGTDPRTGRPDRPLTAFTIEIVTLDEEGVAP